MTAHILSYVTDSMQAILILKKQSNLKKIGKNYNKKNIKKNRRQGLNNKGKLINQWQKQLLKEKIKRNKNKNLRQNRSLQLPIAVKMIIPNKINKNKFKMEVPNLI